MMPHMDNAQVLKKLQINERTEHLVYQGIAKHVKDGKNKEILNQISKEELYHAGVWQKVSGKAEKPNKRKARWLVFLSYILGFTFVLKKMEGGEKNADAMYTELSKTYPEAKAIAADEEKHEKELLGMLDEERLQYVGSMVLGLSDALVELSGTLAGLTFALQNTKLIALSGLITGISATLSMGSSEYLSAKNSGEPNALKSSMYTAIAYVFTVFFVVLPYLVFSNYILAMVMMLVFGVLIILGFTYYTSVAKDMPFGKRFFEMSGISLSVAAISFVIGILVKKFLGLDV